MLGLDYSSSDDSEDETVRTQKQDDKVVSASSCSTTTSPATKPETEDDVSKDVTPSSVVSDVAAETQMCSPVDDSAFTSQSPPQVEQKVTSVFYSDEEVNPDTIARCKQYQSLPNFDLTESIRSKKDFGNPQILDVVVEHFNIDETGSNYPKELFNPKGYRDCDYEDGIRRFNSQARAMAAASAPSVPATNFAPPPSLINVPPSLINTLPIVTATHPLTAVSTVGASDNSGGVRTIISSVTGKKRKSKFSDSARQ